MVLKRDRNQLLFSKMITSNSTFNYFLKQYITLLYFLEFLLLTYEVPGLFYIFSKVWFQSTISKISPLNRTFQDLSNDK